MIQRVPPQPCEVASSSSVKNNLLARSHLQAPKMSDSCFLPTTQTSTRLIHLESACATEILLNDLGLLTVPVFVAEFHWDVWLLFHESVPESEEDT